MLLLKLQEMRKDKRLLLPMLPQHRQVVGVEKVVIKGVERVVIKGVERVVIKEVEKVVVVDMAKEAVMAAKVDIPRGVLARTIQLVQLMQEKLIQENQVIQENRMVVQVLMVHLDLLSIQAVQ